MSYVQFNDIFPAEVVEVQGKPYLFSDLRVERDTIPEHFEAYDVRDDSGDGQFWEVQRFVLVDRWCTIIGMDPIDLDERGQYWCPPDKNEPDYSSEGNFLNITLDSAADFIVWRGALNAYAKAAKEV